MLVLRDLDGLTLHANAAAARLLGFERDATVGRPWPERLEPARRMHTLSRSTTRIEGLPATVFLLGGGHEAGDGDQARVALERSEADLRRVVDGAPDGIAITEGGAFTYVNPALATILGHTTRAELIGRVASSYIEPDERESFEHALQHVALLRVAIAPREFHIVRHDGSEGVFSISAMPIAWRGRQCVLGIARDMTAERRLRRQLVQADRLAALGTLATGIAHEVNSPLAHISFLLEAIDLELASAKATLPPAVDARLAEIRRATDRVATITRELRSFAREDDDARAPLDLSACLELATRMALTTLRHRARIVAHIGPLPRIHGNVARLEQVFLNLLVNAGQAMPAERPPADNEIRVDGRLEPERGVIVEVRDNGSGIPAAIREQIFDPFFTTKPSGVGTGLGLAICRGIVESHGGAITVESELGKGSCFRIVFPMASVVTSPADVATRAEPTCTPSRAAGVAAQAQEQARTKAHGHLRVLVVDDEPGVAHTLQFLLREKHHVEVSTDARDALRAATTSEAFDAIVCDLMMPDMSGIDLFEAVARAAPGRERSIVFMTGGAFTAEAADFLARVSNPRFEKPFRVDDLERALESFAR